MTAGLLQNTIVYANGNRQGPTKLYREDGTLDSETTYEQNIKHGPEVFFHADGTRQLVLTYQQGKRTGRAVLHYGDGKVCRQTAYLADRRQGPAKVYAADGKALAEGLYKDDQPFSGTFIFRAEQAAADPALELYDPAAPYYLEKYEGGQLIESTFYVAAAPYTGPWDTYYDLEKSKKHAHISFRDGKRHGPETRWFENGQTDLSVNWTDSLPDGNLVTYFPNGAKSWEVQFVHGDKSGYERAWDQRGRELCNGEWRQGQPWSGTVIVRLESGEEVVRRYQDGKAKEDGRDVLPHLKIMQLTPTGTITGKARVASPGTEDKP